MSLLLCPAAGAQTSPNPSSTDSSKVLLVDHDFTALGEFVRVFLQEGQVYRAELSSPDLTLQVMGVVRNQELPRVYPFLSSRSPSGTSIVEVYPQVDAVYEIRSISIEGPAIATRMRLYRDISASERRQQVRNSSSWELGMELAGGWHSGFAQTSTLPPSGSGASAGTDIDACFSARKAPDLNRLAMCVLGLSFQSQHGAKSVLWIFTEPRVRILGRSRYRSSWELGVLFRLGLGQVSESPNTPTVLGPGLYLARHLKRSRQGGLTLQATYHRQLYRGFPASPGSSIEVTPKSHRVSLGFGWYR